jgi:DNA-directed RNA polymerase subunit RPC12/RpoP
MQNKYQCPNCGFKGTISDYATSEEEGDGYSIEVWVKCPKCNHFAESSLFKKVVA